jgi:amidohydrolase
VVDGLAYEGQACVCSVGYVRAGTALNVAPTNARLEGTLRTFTKEQLEEAVGRLRALCERYAQSEQISVELDLPVNAPMVVNNQNVTDVLTQVAGEILGASQVLELPPVTPSDDVSEFLNRLEGCHFFVGGGRPDGTSGMHHSPSFLIDDTALQVAASVMANGALALATA